MAMISSSVPDTARTILASSDVKPRDEPLLERVEDSVRATEAVRTSEAVCVINGPSFPDARRWLLWDGASEKLSEGKKSPAEFVREKGVVMLPRLAMPWADASEVSAVL